MKRSRDFDDDDDDLNSSTKVKTDPLLMGDEFEDEQGYLKMDNADRKVWLVKVPKFLFDKWSSVTEEGIDYGKLKIKNSSNTKSGIDVTLELDDRFSQDLPKNYKLQFTNYSPKFGVIPTNEYIFTDNGKGAGVSIEGVVHNEATISPIVDEYYKRIMNSRTEAATKHKRQTQILTVENEKRAHRLTSYNGNSFAAQSKHKKTVQEKRERLPRDEVRRILFEAYEKYDNYNFKGLMEITNQPQSYLKEILAEIAVLNKRGPAVGTWQLKPEYRKK
ncbi:transcription initiation factor IIF, beta subunit [Piromyces finnis]|uniref:Transcription initiation factor IIF subunit beta n=1 Tax=Piromyces finnis TaxID=1754191 RepID=A0A1Y1VF88_9FUNG|nr:transcription initiation factor IIF, beta subunit [Piromyces finnis]|eukprot:ORX54747.1 transcription initiation factor IIF, beta subunit [Piromyces finnis]